MSTKAISITSSLRVNAQQYPDRIATYDVSSGRAQTWISLLDRVAAIGHVLKSALGLNKGDRVALLGFNSDFYFEMMYACPWVGLICVPLNFRLTEEELAYVLKDSGASLLCLDETFAKSTWPKLQPHVGDLRTALLGRDASCLPGSPCLSTLAEGVTERAADAGDGGDDVACIMYTGGTTGKAKGVMQTHCNVVFNALGALRFANLGPGSRFLHVAPLFHVADAQAAYATTLAGGSHYFVPKFNAPELLPILSKHCITTLILIPVMMQMLLALPDLETLAATLKEQEILLWYGGSPLAPATMLGISRLLPHARFLQGFGMTEASGTISFLEHASHADPSKLKTVGRPVPWVEVRIVDEHGAEVPRGHAGEIVVRGPNIMRGYWNLEEQTRQAMCDGYLRTGDGGVLHADGWLSLGDRLKDMIKTGGENVYSVEVERVLSSMPEIETCAVVGAPDVGLLGEIVVAVVVPKAKGTDITLDQVKAHCRKEGLAGYKTPKRVLIREGLPMSGPGKILKNVLRAELSKSAPGGGHLG